MRTVFIVLLCVAAALACPMGMHKCEGIHVDSVPGCHLTGKGCRCVLNHHYHVELTDPATGAHGSSGWSGDKDHCGREAVLGVLLNDRGCNCQTKNGIPLMNCSINAQSCFYFQDEAKLKASSASFRMYAKITAPTPSTEFMVVAANSTQIQTAIMMLYSHIITANPACKVAFPNQLVAGYREITKY